MVVTAGVWGQTAPTTTGAATRPLTRMMEFRFENATVDSVLDEMSARLGFVIEKKDSISQKISVMAPAAVNAEEAVMLLNSVLVSVGYAAVEQPARENLDGSHTRVLRVMTQGEAKKSAPVRE